MYCSSQLDPHHLDNSRQKVLLTRVTITIIESSAPWYLTTFSRINLAVSVSVAVHFGVGIRFQYNFDRWAQLFSLHQDILRWDCRGKTPTTSSSILDHQEYFRSFSTTDFQLLLLYILDCPSIISVPSLLFDWAALISFNTILFISFELTFT